VLALGVLSSPGAASAAPDGSVAIPGTTLRFKVTVTAGGSIRPLPGQTKPKTLPFSSIYIPPFCVFLCAPHFRYFPADGTCQDDGLLTFSGLIYDSNNPSNYFVNQTVIHGYCPYAGETDNGAWPEQRATSWDWMAVCQDAFVGGTYDFGGIWGNRSLFAVNDFETGWASDCTTLGTLHDIMIQVLAGSTGEVAYQISLQNF
jgi:hypothetical protein